MSDKTIKFHLIKSLPEDLVLAPVSSKKLIPEWFKHIPPKVDNNGEEIPSVKKCIPFLDAMSMGYTLLMHIDVVIQQLENGEIRLPYLDEEHKQVLEAHHLCFPIDAFFRSGNKKQFLAQSPIPLHLQSRAWRAH